MPADTTYAAALAARPAIERDSTAPLPEQIAMVLRQGERVAYVNAVLAAGVAGVFATVVARDVLAPWAAVLLVLCALRALSASRALRASPQEVYWQQVHFAVVVLTGLAWGAATWVLGRQASYTLNVFLTFVLAGVAVGAIPTLAPLARLYRTYLIAIAAPVVADFLCRGESLFQVMASMIVIFSATLFITARSYRDALATSWRLAHANQRLIDDLSHTNTTLAATNERLHDEAAERQRSEARFRDAFGHAPIGMALCARSGRISEANRALCEMLARTGTDLLGSPLTALVNPTLPADDYQDACRDITTGVSREYCLATLSGDTRWVVVSFANTRSHTGSADDSLVVQFQDVTQTQEMSRRLLYQARHDDLTGLLNRREFETRLTAALATACDDGAAHAVCYIDLDQFKVINDTCGHAAGDQLLRKLAGMLRSLVRRTDSLARIGGDEFILLMEYCTVEQAQRTANTIRKALEELNFQWGEKRFRLGASIGLVPVTGTTSTLADILSAADTACFAAKEQGRNRIHTYLPSDRELVARQRDMDWVERINRALEEDRFELFYQPIVPADASAAHGWHFELLVRLREADGSLIPPGAFLPAAERYHVITRIDRWVLERTVAWLMALDTAKAPLELCSLNLSGQSLTNDEFLSFAHSTMQRLGTLARCVCFEITETAAISNVAAAENFITSLKTLGCRFALDDFGSGLSSFGYLKTLPVDYLKIDGVFVKDMLGDPVDLALVRSINEVGKALGKLTVAEFVEDDTTRAKLAELGVDFVQGYGVGKPQPLAALAPG